MSNRQRFADEGVFGRRYDYDGRTILVADFGTSSDGSVDLVGGTAIVVVGDDQYEFEVPEGVNTHASMNNGVLTVEVERTDVETEIESESGTETDVETDSSSDSDSDSDSDANVEVEG